MFIHPISRSITIVVSNVGRHYLPSRKRSMVVAVGIVVRGVRKACR